MSFPWSKGSTLVATELNQAIVDRVAKAGDTMTGPLVLSGAPTSNLQAATKQYVDSGVGAIIVPPVPRLTTLIGPFSLPGGVITETDLCSYTLPANTLAVDGQVLRITAWGTAANHSASREARVYFGAANVGFSSIAGSAAVINWQIIGVIVRLGAASQTTMFAGDNGQNSITVTRISTQTSPTEALNGPVVIKATGKTNIAQAGDVIVTAMMVELLQ